MNPQSNAVRRPCSPPTVTERAVVAQITKPCVDWCRSQGFDVTGVQKGQSHPRVFIKNSPLCEKLDGAVHRFERLGNVERRYWFAIRFGCEVRWNDEEVR